MNSRVMQVYYDANLLPFKDKERKVHFPIAGNTFAGNHKTTNIHFYVDQIGGTTGVSWVIVSKLPNGKIGYEPLSAIGYDDEGTPYLDFDMSGYYTSVKGDLYLALRGYQGQITFTDSNSDGIYEINGDPLIEVTGTIKFAINYSPMVNTGTQVLPTDVDRLISALGNYIANGNGIVVLPNTSADISGYENGQMFYVKSEKALYTKSSGSLSFYSKSLQVYPYDIYGFNSSTTLENMYDIVGSQPCLFEYSSGRIWYMGQIKSMGSMFFEFENPIGVQRFIGTSVAGTTTLGTIFNTSGDYYKPYATQDDLDSAITTEDTALKSWANDNFPTKSYVDNHYFKKYPYSVGGIGSSTTLTQLFSTIGTEPAIFQYSSSSGAWYIARLHDIGSGYIFEIEELNGANRWYGNNVAKATTLGNILTNSSSYYLPYATENYVDTKIASLGNVFEYRGSQTVAQLNALTSIGIGDCYNVSDSGTLTAGSVVVIAGDNVVWNGSAWDKLAGTIDLSGYVQKTTTIAGIDLQDNITKAEMLTALGLSNAYTSESISGLTTMAELRTFVDNVNSQGEHCFFDLHTYIDDAYVCLVHCWTENNIKYCFVQDLLNQKTYGDYAGYHDNTTISAYLSGNSMANIKTIKITDSTTTLSDIATLLQEINALGDYVMFDVSGITNAMYLTTIYINGTYYRVFDSVTGRTASGTSTTSLSETLKSVIEGGVVAPSTWEEIHNLVAEGNGSLVYQAGDELDVKFFNSFTATSSNTDLTLSVNRDTFVMKTDMATATYEFTYNSNRSTWVLSEQDVDIIEYGITITGTPANNNKITIAVVVDTIPYIVMGNDQETPSDNDSFSHSLTLRRKYCRDTGLVFDPKEAFFYNGTGAVMPAGTYNFLLGGHSWVSADVGKYFQFTLTQDLPVGGQLVWQQANNVSLVNANLKSYASALDTTEIETCVMTEGQGGTYLGVINNGKPTNATTGYNATYNAYLNQCQRALLGNNDYAQSNIRQMLNSDEEKGTYAQPQNGWDRFATYVLSGNNGFLYDIDPHIKQYVAECKKTTEIVTFTQTSPTSGGRKQSNEKVWLMSREEIQSESASEYNSYPSYTYYHNLLGSTYGDWRTDTRFILTNSAGTAQYYFLRSPYTSYGYYVRFVSANGSVYSDSAYYGGCRVECFAIK